MAIAKKPRDPFENLRKINENMREQMSKMFNRFWDFSNFDFPSLERTGVRKAISDVEDTGKEVVVRMELPGVDKKDIIIKAEGDQLEVSVKKNQGASVNKKNYLYEERSYTGFYRALTLPVNTNSSKVSAKYNNGLLEIRMPKKKIKSGKRIVVK